MERGRGQSSDVAPTLGMLCLWRGGWFAYCGGWVGARDPTGAKWLVDEVIDGGTQRSEKWGEETMSGPAKAQNHQT